MEKHIQSTRHVRAKPGAARHGAAPPSWAGWEDESITPYEYGETEVLYVMIIS
jgi:hypothetical protein